MGGCQLHHAESGCQLIEGTFFRFCVPKAEVGPQVFRHRTHPGRPHSPKTNKQHGNEQNKRGQTVSTSSASPVRNRTRHRGNDLVIDLWRDPDRLLPTLDIHSQRRIAGKWCPGWRPSAGIRRKEFGRDRSHRPICRIPLARAPENGERTGSRRGGERLMLSLSWLPRSRRGNRDGLADSKVVKPRPRREAVGHGLGLGAAAFEETETHGVGWWWKLVRSSILF